jgi:hypothetical protein
MSAIENYPKACTDIAPPKRELLEIHSSKISLHHAKTDYNYPTIRLPYKFSKLAGLRTHIYQTVHNGALAFLVVVSSSHKKREESARESENVATSSKPSPLHGEGQAFESPRSHRLFFQSGARIKPEAAWYLILLS